MTNEEKNSLAYKDCLDYQHPSYPNDEVYMERYRFWRQIARFPEDLEIIHEEDYY